MATDRENTLQIKDFRGISRFFASPNNPPNKLQTIQNLYSPNRGELAYMGGTTQSDMSADGFGTALYSTKLNNQLVVFCQQTLSDLPTPSIDGDGFTVSTRAGAGATVNVTYYITYCGLGYETNQSAGKTVAFRMSGTDPVGVTWTVPLTIPAKVSSINIYQVSTTRNVWVATVYRQNGVFPTTFNIDCYNPPEIARTTTCSDVPASFTATPKVSASGTLEDERIYYFAVAPWVSKGTGATGLEALPEVNPIASYQAPTTVMTAYLPKGYNSFDITMGVTGLYDGVNPYTQAVVLMGLSQETMVAVGHDDAAKTRGTADIASPWLVASLTSPTIPYRIYNMPFGTNSGICQQAPGGSSVKTYYYPMREGFMATQGTASYRANQIAAVILPEGSGTYSSTTCRQILPARGYLRESLSPSDLTTGWYNFTLEKPENYPSTNLTSTQMGDILYLANGVTLQIYTDGNIFVQLLSKPNVSPLIPICPNIVAFKNRLLLGGGPNNTLNTIGFVYYSEENDPFDWGVGLEVNNFSCRGASISAINGFGILSYNQSTNGQTNQLVISTGDAVWLISEATGSPQEVSRNIGFCSPFAAANTNIGTLFVGHDNVYQFLDNGKPSPRGNDVASIIKEINKNNREVLCVFHQGHLKIAYNSSGVAPYPYDTELWCDLQLESDGQGGEGPRYVWTGPHTMNSVTFQTVMPISLNTSYPDDQRFAVAGTAKVQQLDVPSLTSCLGAAVARKLVFNDLYLNADQFIKILTRFYVGAKYNSLTPVTVPVTVTFNMTDENSIGDGNGDGEPTAFTESFDIVYSGQNQYKLLQQIFSERYRGRVIQAFTLEWNGGSVDETLSIYDLSILFQPTRRREL